MSQAGLRPRGHIEHPERPVSVSDDQAVRALRRARGRRSDADRPDQSGMLTGSAASRELLSRRPTMRTANAMTALRHALQVRIALAIG